MCLFHYVTCRCLTPLSSHTMPHCRFISWSRTPTRRTASTTRHCTTSVSARWSWARRRTATWTTSCRPRCPAWPPACDSPASWTPTCVSWPSTWFHSRACISSCPALRRWRRVAASSTVRCRFQNWRSRCLMQRTWWLHAIRVMDATSPSRPSSVVACRWKRYCGNSALNLCCLRGRLSCLGSLLTEIRWMSRTYSRFCCKNGA